METLRELIDGKLAQTNDVEQLKKLVVQLATLADSKGATEAEMKEMFRTDLVQSGDHPPHP